MKRIITVSTAVGIILLAGVALLLGREPSPQPERFVAHEWGTFTSVANDTGEPARWAPWTGPPDLPCFVFTSNHQYKASVLGTVRMETPVIYFYSPGAQRVSVDVQFPKGIVTEWFPSATSVGGVPNKAFPVTPQDGSISWNSIDIVPQSKAILPQGKGASHYYAARETDAAPLRVNGESEKLLFYRGIGLFAPPLRAWYPDDGKLWMRNAGKEEIPLAIMFENRGDKVGYRVVRDLKDEEAVEAPEMTASLPDLRSKLQHELIAAGLYEKEAAAMIETWRDSWFEKGTRVFYVMPRAAVNRVLPLKITPAPEETVRVFVARLELLSPWTEQEIASADQARDLDRLKAFGRFLPVFAQQMKLNSATLEFARRELANEFSRQGCVE